jgi:hypothetical protein
MDDQAVIDVTKRWIASFVVGLNLCPFARRVFESNLIRFVVSSVRDEAALLKDLTDELQLLASEPITRIETTLVIHPHVLGDFLDYNDFLDLAEQRVCDLELEGVVQIASFHPQYQFADTEADALENYTNRSPFPMLHLLREESVSAVADKQDELLEIPRRNIETLDRLGLAKVVEILAQCGRQSSCDATGKKPITTELPDTP